MKMILSRLKFLATLFLLPLAGCGGPSIEDERSKESTCPFGHTQRPIYIHFHMNGFDGAACSNSKCRAVYVPFSEVQ